MARQRATRDAAQRGDLELSLSTVLKALSLSKGNSGKRDNGDGDDRG